MPRPRSERRSPWPAVVLGVALLLLPVIYVASIGPAAKLSWRGGPSEGQWVADGFLDAYGPLLAVYDRVPVARPPLNWWVGIWIGPQRDWVFLDLAVLSRKYRVL